MKRFHLEQPHNEFPSMFFLKADGQQCTFFCDKLATIIESWMSTTFVDLGGEEPEQIKKHGEPAYHGEAGNHPTVDG